MTFLLWLAACTTEVEVDVPGQSPVALILDPLDVTTLRAGPAALVGRVSDPQSDPFEIFAAWELEGEDGWERACSGFAEADGTTLCGVDLRPDHRAVRLVAKDAFGFEGEDRVAIEVRAGAAPDVRWTAPVAPGPFFANLEVPIEVWVDDPDGLAGVTVAFVDNLDGALPLPSTPDAAGRLAGLARLRAGDHAIEVVATDADGDVGRATTRFAVRPDNAAPTVRIDAPRAGAAALPGAFVAVEAVVLDDAAAPDALTVTVASDRDGPLGALAVGEGARAAGDVALDAVGVHRLRVTAVDPWGAAGIGEVEVVVDLPPTVIALAPADGAALPVGSPVTVTVRVADNATDPAAISVAVASDRDGPRWSQRAAADGRATAVTTLSPGVHTLTATARDALGLVGEVAWTVTVGP